MVVDRSASRWGTRRMPSAGGERFCVWFELGTGPGAVVGDHARRLRRGGSGPPPGEGADGAGEAALPPDLKPPIGAVDYPSVGSDTHLPAKAGPVPDRLTIWPVDDGRYGLDATFQGVSAARARPASSRRSHAPRCAPRLPSGARRRLDAAVWAAARGRRGQGAVGVRLLIRASSSAGWSTPISCRVP